MSTEEVARFLSSRMTRRSFIAQAAKLALAATGISVVGEHLARFTPTAEAGSHTCADSLWCGLCGTRCNDTACGGTAGLPCPSGSWQGNSWSFCCLLDGISSFVIDYIDCCGASNCGTKCWGNCPQNDWCSGAFYKCTVARVGAAC